MQLSKRGVVCERALSTQKPASSVCERRELRKPVPSMSTTLGSPCAWTQAVRRARALFCNSEYSKIFYIKIQRSAATLGLSAAARRKIA
jgi:hypothetical protein